MGVITSTANPAVKAARKLGRRQRRDQEDFLVEGPQAVREALPHLRRLFVTDQGRRRSADLVAAAETRDVDVLDVTDAVLASVSDAVTPQGVVGVASLPEPSLDAVLGRAALVVVLWRVADPGNAGTIVRTSDAAGADAVVLTAGSVDVRNPKAVRASAGSVFHLPVITDAEIDDVLAAARKAGLRVIGAAPHAGLLYCDADLARPTAIVLGNEARGLPRDVLAACDEVVHLPLAARERPGYQGVAESLNLAATAAVLTYEAARQRRVQG